MTAQAGQPLPALAVADQQLGAHAPHIARGYVCSDLAVDGHGDGADAHGRHGEQEVVEVIGLVDRHSVALDHAEVVPAGAEAFDHGEQLRSTPVPLRVPGQRLCQFDQLTLAVSARRELERTIDTVVPTRE
ncbi:hypothetical protein D3C72_1816800 [compost metagenome]